jgi:hypothetical protein
MQISKEQAIEYLTRWHEKNTAIGVYLSVPGAVAGLTMLAQITEVSVRIVITNESSILRFSLDNARFEYGPMHVWSLPSQSGPAVVLTHLSQGLLSKDGLHIRLDSGFSLFLCEDRELEKHWLVLTASSMVEQQIEGFLQP